MHMIVYMHKHAGKHIGYLTWPFVAGPLGIANARTADYNLAAVISLSTQKLRRMASSITFNSLTRHMELVTFNTTILNTTTFNTWHLIPTTINPDDN